MKIKKKLRDVTYEEFVARKYNNCFGKTCANCMFGYVRCDFKERYNWTNNKDLYSDKFLDQEIEIEIEVSGEILTDAEKEWLSIVIKPFKNRVRFIRKNKCTDGEYITIAIGDDDYTCLPYFEQGTMYRGMISEEEYTLEELGL